MTNDQPTRVALIGCGRIARTHARYLRDTPGVDLVGLCDRDLDCARALQQGSERTEVFARLDDLLSMKALDAVHVLTPPASHADVALAALERGLHVLVEKPMATTAAAAARLQDAATRAGRLLCVDHNRLFDPPIVQAHELVATGKIGQLLSVEAFQGVNVQEGGAAAGPLDMWLNLAPHPLYLLRSLIGEITGWQSCSGPLGELRALFKGTHALGALYFSPGAAPYLNALTLYGTEGTLHLDLNTMTLLRRRERRLPKMLAKAALNLDQALQLVGGTIRTTAQVATRRLATYPGMGHVIRGFYDAIRTGSPAPTSATDGQRVVELLEGVWAQAHPKDTSTPRRSAAGVLSARSGPVVLVTGAGGFLGRHVVDALLQDGHRVRALMHASAPPSEWDETPGIDIVSGDLGDDDSIKHAMLDVETIVHCAARVARRGTREDFFRDNVAGTTRLLKAAQAGGVERFIHVSSIGIYGGSEGSTPISEETMYDPRPDLRGAYTWSKLEADRVVQETSRDGCLRTVIIRPGIIVGSGGPRFTARLALGSLFGRSLIVGHRRALLPLCHVDDVAAAVIAAIRTPEARGPYNIVDEELTQEEWLQSLGHNGTAMRPTFLPPLLLSIPAAGLELACRMTKRPTPALSRYKIRRATESLRYDTRRARRDLRWSPKIGVRSLTNGSEVSKQKGGLSATGFADVHTGGGLP